MKRWLLVAAGALVSLVASFAAGRWTAPVQTTERVVTLDREVSSRATAYVGHVERITDTSTKWRERIVYRQGETVVEREQVQATHAEERTDEKRTEASTVAVEKTSNTERSPITPRPRWAVEALAGVTLGERRPVGGLGAQVRLGDWWAGAWGMATAEVKAAGLSLRKEF
jgi:hypothetical protein